MEAQKIYLQPIEMVLAAINDLVELQNGKLTFSDTPHGKIHFLIRMYVSIWELKFTVADIGKNRSNVQLEVCGEPHDSQEMIEREFALLDSMLVIGAKTELADKKEDG